MLKSRMEKFYRVSVKLLFVAVMAGFISFSLTTTANAGGKKSKSAAKTGDMVMADSCTQCHSTGRITAKKGLTVKAWNTIIVNMQSMGATISIEDKSTLANYLAENYK